jgi:ribosome modulation factor
VLDQHPLGVDETVLAEFREFREFVRRLAPRPGESEAPGPKTPANQAYLDGYGACMAGRRMTDNPHPVDAAEYMAWDAGWFEAMDEAIERDEGAADAGEGEKP